MKVQESIVDDFYAADLDGDSLEMGVTEDRHAIESYDAFLSVTTSSNGMYLDRHQAERLRDWLNEALR